MSMHDFCTKFVSLLRYVPYLNEEKPKIQIFLGCLPNFYKDKLEFDELKTLYEAMRQAELTYDQSKSKSENPFNFKRRDGHGFKRREFKPFIKHKIFKENTFKDKQPTIRTEYKQPMRTAEYKDTNFNNKSEEKKREPLQCWGCGGDSFLLGLSS